MPTLEVNFGYHFKSVMNNIPKVEPPVNHEFRLEYPYNDKYLKQDADSAARLERMTK